MATTNRKGPSAASLDEMPEVDFTRAKVVGRGRRATATLAMPLAALRTAVGKTQVDVATASEMNQGDVSRIERRAPDGQILIDTLRRYVRALGGDLEVVALVGGKRVRLDV